MEPLRIVVDDRSLSATWVPDNRATAEAVAAALPVEGRARRWGDELYLPVDIEARPETTQETVDPGAVAYWPDGPALCVFWGPTPASVDDEPRAASPVGVLATIEDYRPLEAIDGEATVRFTRAP